MAVERAAYDQMVHDALLFDEGALAAYLELGPVVRDRAPGVLTWPSVRPRLVELRSASPDGACCEDLVTGEPVLVGDSRLGEQHPVGRCFYGRLVAVDGDPRSWFATLPTVVEPEAVLEVLDGLRRDVGAEELIDAAHRPLRRDA